MSHGRIPPTVLRRALLHPWVRRQGVIGRLPGLRVDADSLRQAVALPLPENAIPAAHLDDALRAVSVSVLRSAPSERAQRGGG